MLRVLPKSTMIDIDVPDTDCPLSEEQLQNYIDPMQNCCDYGFSLYMHQRGHTCMHAAVTSVYTSCKCMDTLLNLFLAVVCVICVVPVEF